MATGNVVTGARALFNIEGVREVIASEPLMVGDEVIIDIKVVPEFSVDFIDMTAHIPSTEVNYGNR